MFTWCVLVFANQYPCDVCILCYAVTFLIQVNFCYSSVDARGNTPLHLAAEAGHKEIVQYLVAVEADIDVNDQIGYEPVHMAALHGHVNCLMILVAMGASLSSKTNDCKLPIHLAAMKYAVFIKIRFTSLCLMFWCRLPVHYRNIT